MKKLIYIADDDENILNIVKMFLESNGYDVKTFTTGDSLFDEFNKKSPDLIILDIMMPGTDGLTICNKIRNISSVPIILLTAKDSDCDYIEGITLGSDDYLTKPFKPTILTMRVKSLLRRVEMTDNTSKNDDITCGDLVLSNKKRNICCNNKEINLTQTEFLCLSYLMKHFKEAVSRESLLNEVWGYDNSVETRVTDETIRRIRKKLISHNSNIVIANKWGYGYILKEDNNE